MALFPAENLGGYGSDLMLHPCMDGEEAAQVYMLSEKEQAAAEGKRWTPPHLRPKHPVTGWAAGGIAGSCAQYVFNETWARQLRATREQEAEARRAESLAQTQARLEQASAEEVQRSALALQRDTQSKLKRTVSDRTPYVLGALVVGGLFFWSRR